MTGLPTLEAALRRALDAADLPSAVIGIDVSANEHRDAEFDPHWVLHPRVHVPAVIDAARDRVLRRHFPASDLIPRPLRVVTFDGDFAGIAYGMKPNFERRQSYRQEKATAWGKRVCRNTRGRPLRGTEFVELALFLDCVGLRRRLILHRTVLTRTRDGAVIIRPTRQPGDPGPRRHR